jgi:hypothetical protein
MTVIRTGKPYSSIAILASLAVPLELFAGGAQPHTENEALPPGLFRIITPAISGINVSAQSIRVSITVPSAHWVE